MGVSTLKWEIDRPFLFFENGVSYKRYLSIYHSLQADSPRGNPAVAAPGAGISRSFLTVRVQPAPRIDFDFNHTYFRDIPRSIHSSSARVCSTSISFRDSVSAHAWKW